jgi:hypothetical protein
MREGTRALAVLLALVIPVTGGAKDAGGERPRLELRASPRIAYPPARVYVVAELQGGGEVEELYCPGVQWEWGDGSRSGVESDCDPFEPGTRLVRVFSAGHAYRDPGEYDLRVTLRRAGRDLAAATIQVMIIHPDTALGGETGDR